MKCPKCSQFDRIIKTPAKSWYVCKRCSLPFSVEDKASPRKREKVLREMRVRDRLRNR
jgi:transposase-like protein